ncbi:MAG: methyltransferase [Verrucomicrobia bacterium]|jgi:hypothetical protein|nr:methyltransferase [Verrucomicrobiota bacterium]MBT7064899.1 methyltransferase [Verrucomicrobiota bacterium]MBT7699974.1 methyltransferase [Verrucomicrobiota bacterium]
MTPAERLQATLNHEQPDRVCVDLGSTPTSGMHVSIVQELRQAYGLKKRPVKVCEPYQMLGEIDADLQDALQVDTTALPAVGTIFGFRNVNWKPFTTPWGQDVLVPEGFRTTVDTHGDLLIYPEGDLEAGASARMPVGSFFFDAIIRQPPIEEESLDPEDNLEDFTILDSESTAWFRREGERLRGSQRAVVASLPGTAFGDIALVPAPFLKKPKGIRDITEWYMATAMRPDYIHAVFEKQCEIALKNLEIVNEAAGDVIDVVFVCGTDFGTQTSQFCSVQTFNDLYAPYYKQVNDWIHAHTKWKTFKHSCGAVIPFIESFIDAGFDILNPVQCSAAGMDPATLKQTYGDRIVFWGGGVDTQKTLPFGTPEEVDREVRERVEIFSDGGGFVFDAIHNVQAQTPIENVVAMFKALADVRGL